MMMSVQQWRLSVSDCDGKGLRNVVSHDHTFEWSKRIKKCAVNGINILLLIKKFFDRSTSWQSPAPPFMTVIEIRKSGSL